MVHIKHKVIELQVSVLVCSPKFPFQQAIRSITDSSITQIGEHYNKRVIINTKTTNHFLSFKLLGASIKLV